MQEYTRKKRKKRKTTQSIKRTKVCLYQENDFNFWFPKNWRPISWVNVDVNIASKTNYRKTITISNAITYSRQPKRCYKSTVNLDVVRTIDDVLEIGKIMSQPRASC